MKLSIRWKILLFIIVPIVGIYLSVMTFNIFKMRQWTTINIEQRMTELANSYADRFDSRLRETAQIAKMTAAYIENNPHLKSDQIYALLRTNLQQNPLVYGSAVCFEPYTYQPNLRLFVRYVYRDGDTLRQANPAATGYDYTEAKQEYWHKPKTTGKAIWTEPYFDEGGGNILMCTYSVPFYRNGKFLGIATVDIPLEPLHELVDIGISKDIKFSIITKAGKYVSSPYLERINKSIFEIAKKYDREELIELPRKITSGKIGMEKRSGWTSAEREWIFYGPVKSAQWGFAASISEKQALKAVQEQYYRNLTLLIISLILIFGSLWFLSSQISLPIARLNYAVSEIAKGNLDIRAEMKRNDEIGVLASAFDDMAQKLSAREQALQESENKYRMLIEHLPSVVYRGYKDWSVYFIDRKVELLTGYDVDEFNSGKMKWSDLIFEEDIKAAKESFIQALKTDRLYIREYRIKSKTEETLWIQERGQIACNDKGEIEYVNGVFFDISEHKRAENALIKEKDRAQMYLDIAGVMFVALDANGKVALVNKKGCEILGNDEEEILGKNWFDHFLPEENREQVKGIFQQLMKGEIEPVEYYENQILTKSGEQRILAWHNTVLKNEKGDIINTFSSGEDITEQKIAEEERKKLETQLQQAQKMEAVGTLAGGIAHDFNNILFSIIGYTELALGDVDNRSLFHKYLHEVLTAGQRAKDLVNQILAFSRQAEQELKPVLIKLIAKEVLKLLRASLPATIEIKQSLQSDTTVLADPTQIHQVLMNLCTNAGHAMREKGGVLDVSLVNVELDADFTDKHPDLKPGPYLKLTVSDTGHGMPPHVVDRVFDPFFTTKEKGEGTGMGLSVVHGIVKSHGGAVAVYSAPEKGSVFNVFLPAIEEKAKLKQIMGKPIPRGTERILFIDDEQPLVDMGKILLESLGYDVVTKTGSVEALELFKAQPDSFDLVITDMTMPKMTGDELAGELLRIKHDIPIILCTGFSAMINEDKAKTMGIRAFIFKPILMRDMAETIRAVLDG